MLLTVLAFGNAEGMAQYDQTINVEGRYLPEVVRMDRINTYPGVKKFTLENSGLPFSLQGVPTDFTPVGLTMPATGWNSTRHLDDSRGYLDLGLGSWLTSTLSAGYRFLDLKNAYAGVTLQHNSTSLYRPEDNKGIDNGTIKRYDEKIGLYGSMRLGEAGWLSGTLDYHIGNFNYYGYHPYLIPDLPVPDRDDPYSYAIPNQTLNEIGARVNWLSNQRGKLAGSATLGYHYFGFRRYYLPVTEDFSPMFLMSDIEGYKPSRESHVYLDGGLSYRISAAHEVDLGVNINVVGYSNNGISDAEDMTPDTYGLVTLSPAYRFAHNHFNFAVGLNLDIAAKAGLVNYRYSTLHVSPILKVEYNGNGAGLYLHLNGGSRLHTLAGEYERNYYCEPNLYNTTPEFTPLEGSLGLNVGPFSGFRAGVHFDFRFTQHQYTGGWYTAMLSYDTYPMPGINIDSRTEECLYMTDNTYSIHGFSLGGDVEWDINRFVKLNASVAYQPQNGETGYFNGYDRPRWLLDAAATVSPVERLKIKLGYNYRGVRQIWVNTAVNDGTGFWGTSLEGMRLPDLTILNLGASWSFSTKFDVWLQGDNLLNRHDVTLPMLYQPGITVTAGLAWRF